MASKKEKGGALTVAEMGAMGGTARAKNMTKKERSASASNAAKARWAEEKRKSKEPPPA